MTWTQYSHLTPTPTTEQLAPPQPPRLTDDPFEEIERIKTLAERGNFEDAVQLLACMAGATLRTIGALQQQVAELKSAEPTSNGELDLEGVSCR